VEDVVAVVRLARSRHRRSRSGRAPGPNHLAGHAAAEDARDRIVRSHDPIAPSSRPMRSRGIAGHAAAVAGVEHRAASMTCDPARRA